MPDPAVPWSSVAAIVCEAPDDNPVVTCTDATPLRRVIQLALENDPAGPFDDHVAVS